MWIYTHFGVLWCAQDEYIQGFGVDSMLNFHAVHLDVGKQYYYRSFERCKLDYRTESNRIRLTLFSWSSIINCTLAAIRATLAKKNERRFENKKKMLNPSAMSACACERIKFCWLISWNVSWQPRRYEQYNDKVDQRYHVSLPCLLSQIITGWERII